MSLPTTNAPVTPGRSLYPEVGMYDLTARLTVAEAAVHFALSKATINRWYTLGHLKDVTLDKDGHRLYLFDELLKAERTTRRSPQSSRSLVRRGLVTAAR